MNEKILDGSNQNIKGLDYSALLYYTRQSIIYSDTTIFLNTEHDIINSFFEKIGYVGIIYYFLWKKVLFLFFVFKIVVIMDCEEKNFVKSKKFLMTFSIVFVLLIVINLGLILCVDPCGVYHKPWFGLKNVNFDQVYQNPGYVKHYDYDTVLIGSSMVEGFRVSYVNEVFGVNAIKLCRSGSYSKDLAKLMELVCETGKADTIIVGIDDAVFRKPCDEYRSKMPLYLYNDLFYDDMQYLFGKQTLLNAFKMLYLNVCNETKEIDDYYILNMDNYSKEIMLKNYERNIIPSEDWNRAEINIKNIICQIEKNPDVQFYLFVPPYSILFWEQFVTHDALNDKMKLQKMVLESFLEYDNVKLFYFMDDESIVTNLDNYMDAGHYSPEICKLLVKKMYNGENMVTKDNYIEIINHMEELVINYDYDKIFKLQDEVMK